MSDRPAPELDEETKRAIRRLPRALREDAQQEAYLAMLQDESPAQAVQNFGRCEQNPMKPEPVGFPIDPTDDRKPIYSPTLFLDFCRSYVLVNGHAGGMKSKAAEHFGVDRRMVSRWLSDIRASKSIGRGVFQKWRDSLD